MKIIQKSKLKSKTEKTDIPILFGGDDPFTGTIVVGAVRSGKSATIIKPLIYEILKQKKIYGREVGLTVLEPKGDVARFVTDVADFLGLENTLIDPEDKRSGRLNVMEGDSLDVAESTVTVLKSLFGKQDPFFQAVQELSARNITLLLKEVYGDRMDMIDVLKNLRDESLLKKNVDRLRKKKGNTDLVQFFEAELLGSMKEKYRQFVIGLRTQLENITSNDRLRKMITGKSSIDLDEHMEKGGILAINTSLGRLSKSGDAFGMFASMNIQQATYRRGGTENTRVPHYFIIDEASRYINPDTERFLSVAPEYRVASLFAIQSLGQLEVESGTLSARAVKKAFLTSTRNKIVFGGLSSDDAKEVAEEMGQDRVLERVKSFDGGIMKQFLPKMYRDMETDQYRFPYTKLMDGLPRFHFVYKISQDGHPQPPQIGVGNFVPRDWKQALIDEMKEKEYQEANRPPIYRLRERWEWDVKQIIKQKRDIDRKRQLEVIQRLKADNPFKAEKKQAIISSENQITNQEKEGSIEHNKTNNQDDDLLFDINEENQLQTIQQNNRKPREQIQNTNKNTPSIKTSLPKVSQQSEMLLFNADEQVMNQTLTAAKKEEEPPKGNAFSLMNVNRSKDNEQEHDHMSFEEDFVSIEQDQEDFNNQEVLNSMDEGGSFWN